MNLSLSRLILLRMRNAHFFFFENHTVYETCVKLLYSPAGHRLQQDTFGFRIPKVTNTHSEYAILLAFPLQQWLYERA